MAEVCVEGLVEYMYIHSFTFPPNPRNAAAPALPTLTS